MSKHCIILVPGLGDRILRHQWLTKKWKEDGIEVIIHTAPWNKTQEKFQPKLDRLLKHIDQLSNNGYKVSLIGTSAGGSFVINAYLRRKSKVHKVINVCGRIRKGEHVYPSLKQAARDFTAFYESVIFCEENLRHLTSQDEEKIMTVSPWPIDGIVPMNCIPIQGARNISIPVPLHILGICVALSVFRKPLIEFILASNY